MFIALTRYPNPTFAYIKIKIKLTEYDKSDVKDEMYTEK
ncbi:hypothetical protein ADIARSV_2335 [Arcticibacter svalbardensis MN12-7]|uniref:Uncharacterized protein n=1 Tax=Arcticibacter svalbardensis MN12-7 TaxID=1150600 RepID=R9GZS5_9SPHI|nr:hypothetical protein ADIARSV_2335 [Arcticibacter svalbardensis MN12-7]